VGLEVELGGLAMMGIVGRTTAKVLKSEIKQSLKNFRDLYG
jgi:hypothetical protein